jgi:hypothetical protein
LAFERDEARRGQDIGSARARDVNHDLLLDPSGARGVMTTTSLGNSAASMSWVTNSTVL